eukprot:jgi/Tetstr1/427410/TSEL_017574.t1
MLRFVPFAVSEFGSLAPHDDPFAMPGSGSPTAPKMVDAGKAAAVGGIGRTATEQDPIEAAHRREAVAPRATYAKDATENSGKSKAKVEPPSVDKPNDEVLRRADPMEMRCEDTPLSAPSK